MGKRTPLYDEHVKLGAKIVDFAGWDMPLHYGSQVDEHYEVRRDAGMFDVSHMTIIDIDGSGARDLLKYLLANDVDRLKNIGKALYSCMLNEQGGIMDDLIVSWLGGDSFRVVVNAGTREKDIGWIEKQAEGYNVNIKERDDLALIAVQGPEARDKVHKVFDEKGWGKVPEMKPFNAVELDDLFISRTGYTGEDGYEVALAADKAVELWRALRGKGVRPIGLGARDMLRLEAGMNLYGTDMDESTTPMESGLSWTVAWEPEDRIFIGRAALEEKRKDTTLCKLVGLVLNDKGVLRSHQKVFNGNRHVGEVTSGTFSPILGKAVAFARVSPDVEGDCLVEMRGKQLAATVVKPPFVRHGKACMD